MKRAVEMNAPKFNRVLKGMVLAMSLLLAACAPAINDISTDLTDPPVFKTLREGKKQTYPEKNAEKQRAHYADLGPLLLPMSPEAAFLRALKVAHDMEWDVVTIAPEEGRIEAVDTTLIFRFKDDVVVRVRAEGTGSRIDVRSASRVGKGDLGKNAARIREYLGRIRAASQRGKGA
jgi:uncharacterized protein (DUF1499 family)